MKGSFYSMGPYLSRCESAFDLQFLFLFGRLIASSSDVQEGFASEITSKHYLYASCFVSLFCGCYLGCHKMLIPESLARQPREQLCRRLTIFICSGN